MIELEQLHIAYQQKTILQASSLTIQSPNFIALIGRNGSGKSSLLRCLSRLQRPVSGQISLAGEHYQNYSAEHFARQISIVNTNRINFPYLSVKELISLGRHPHLKLGGRLSQKDHQKIELVIQICGLEELAMHPLSKCSDGERQKAMLARALAQDTPILLLDEITAHLDFVHRHQSFQLLQKLAHDEQKLVIMATHEVELALKYADRILILHKTQLHNLTPKELKASSLLEEIFEGII